MTNFRIERYDIRYVQHRITHASNHANSLDSMVVKLELDSVQVGVLKAIQQTYYEQVQGLALEKNVEVRTSSFTSYKEARDKAMQEVLTGAQWTLHVSLMEARRAAVQLAIEQRRQQKKINP